MMEIPKNIRENLRFLTAEVGTQVANLQGLFETPSVTIAQRILDRGGYAYNLKMRIHESCLNHLSNCRGVESDRLSLRSMESIATDLDRISELCRDCVHRMEYLQNRRYLPCETYGPLLERIGQGIGLIEKALLYNDTQLALKIGRIEQRLDQAYKKLLKKYTKKLKRKKDTEELISALFVAQSMEQMGDVLLTISEAIISVNLGQPVNTERYHSLRASVEQLGGVDAFSELTIKTIAETRSGSGISGISSPEQGDEGYVAIFKDGKKRKLKGEREGVESWHEIFPGLAPRILSYNKRGQSAALLIEHLAGLTFEQILLHESPALLEETLIQLSSTLKSVWRETRSKKKVSAQYMQQLAKRLDEVYAIHPEFRQSNSRVCGCRLPSFDTLLKKAQAYEDGIHAPFSVYIHGDFNLDNIIYDPVEQRINFIDLHRSRYTDYVQDISVFMVSNYRQQILDVPLRRRIMKVALDFYDFAGNYAEKMDDKSFKLRLALGLARSFATSTRFILDKSLARAMFLRARYLIECVLAADPKRAAEFQLPIKEIFIG
ncbi:MAG: PhoU domain-containing protein [Sedimenticola sp.]